MSTELSLLYETLNLIIHKVRHTLLTLIAPNLTLFISFLTATLISQLPHHNYHQASPRSSHNSWYIRGAVLLKFLSSTVVGFSTTIQQLYHTYITHHTGKKNKTVLPNICTEINCHWICAVHCFTFVATMHGHFKFFFFFYIKVTPTVQITHCCPLWRSIDMGEKNIQRGEVGNTTDIERKWKQIQPIGNPVRNVLFTKPHSKKAEMTRCLKY